MASYFILKDKKVIPEKDLLKWSEWFESSILERIVNKTKVDGYMVSTVFLGMNHGYLPYEEPEFFETMIFNDEASTTNMPDIDYLERYATWEQAEIGHKKAVEWLKNHLLESYDET